MLRRQCDELLRPAVEESVRHYNQGAYALLPKRSRGFLRLSRMRLRIWIIRVHEAADHQGCGYGLVQRFELFGHDCAGNAGYARNVAARSVKASNEAELDWIADDG